MEAAACQTACYDHHMQLAVSVPGSAVYMLHRSLAAALNRSMSVMATFRLVCMRFQSSLPDLDPQVYDVSSWAPEHPGGRVVYTYAGKDATDVFAGFHSPAAWAVLKPLYVGELLVRFWSSRLALLHHFALLLLHTASLGRSKFSAELLPGSGCCW